MRERHECHCMLFLTADNEFVGEEDTLTVEEVRRSAAAAVPPSCRAAAAAWPCRAAAACAAAAPAPSHARARLERRRFRRPQVRSHTDGMRIL